MAAPAMGWVGEDIVDAAEDIATSVIDRVVAGVKTLADAQKIIGIVLQYAAPIVAMWPGIGTAVSVALSAASAVALGTPVDDAIINAASNAIPGGLPRIAFNSSVKITRDLAEGKNAWPAVIDACRSTAQTAGGDRALQAFDQGLAIARGQKVSDGTIALGRAQLVQSGAPTEALAAYDSGVILAKGGDANDVLFAVARDYIAANGGPLALAAFDSGLALAHGASLQEAGFAALRVFVKGNDSAERALNFAEKMVRAAREGKDLKTVIINDLSDELAPFLGAMTPAQLLAPLFEAMRVDPSALAWGSQQLADAWGYAEPVVRAAQAAMSDGSGRPDPSVLGGYLIPKTIGRAVWTQAQQAAEDARFALVVAAHPGVPPICLHAQEAKDRGSPAYAGLAAQCAAIPAVQRAGVVSTSVSSSGSTAALTVSKVVVSPVGMPVPFKPPAVAASVLTGASSAGTRSSLGEDVALGGVIGVAALALLWWSKG